MMEAKAKTPFEFYTSSLLVEITGKRAHHLKEFVEILKKIDASSVFYHVHHSFREYHFAPGKYSNDFARWVGEDLEENVLAERLASINVRDFTTIEALRQKIIQMVEEHLETAVEIRKAAIGREFYFLRNITIAMATECSATSIKEFVAALNKIGMRSLYFHCFDARLRLGRKTNDFSEWFATSLGRADIAQKIEALDPYFMTMDELKKKDYCSV